MAKWLFVLVIAAGAAWHFAGNKNAPPPVVEMPQTTRAPPTPALERSPPAQTSTREPSEEQCRSIGGRMVSGMGCVVGAPTGDANSQVSPSEMAAHCQSSGKRYVREINACVSN